MYGVPFTVYVPAGAVLLRAIWVKHSPPIPELHGSGDAGVDATIAAPPSAAPAIVPSAGGTAPDAPSPTT